MEARRLKRILIDETLFLDWLKTGFNVSGHSTVCSSGVPE